MEKYRVKVIQHALKNNKIAESGDIVTEAQLTGSAADLVKKGFIEKVGQKEEADKAGKEAFEKAYDEGSLDESQLDSITKDDIYNYAEKHNLEFDKDAKKADLIEQVLKAGK